MFFDNLRLKTFLSCMSFNFINQCRGDQETCQGALFTECAFLVFSQHPAGVYWSYCAGEPLESVVYCLNTAHLARHFKTNRQNEDVL